MVGTGRKSSAVCRCVSIITAFLFPLFLLIAQPHRVHHFFDDLSESHCAAGAADKACRHHSDQKLPAQTHCAIQSSAQNSHLSHVPFVQVVFIEASFEFFDNNLIPHLQHFSFSPFLGRAPPGTALLLNS
jgi:hypothetical protein